MLVEEWMAYTISKLQGADPTLETISAMVQSEFNKKVKPVLLDSSISGDLDELKIYNAADDYADDDIMSSYVDLSSPKVSETNKGHLLDQDLKLFYMINLIGHKYYIFNCHTIKPSLKKNSRCEPIKLTMSY